MIDMSNIEPLPSGHFRLRLQVNGKPIRGTFATVEEAIAVRDAAKREIADGRMVIVEGQSLVQSEKAFFLTREGNRSVSDDRLRWKSHLATASFAHRPVPTISRRDILDWLDGLKTKLTAHRWGKRSAKPLGWQTRKHCRNLLSAFLDWAVDREIIVSNPAAGIVVAREDGDEDSGYQETWYLDALDQLRLLACWDRFEKPIEKAEKWIVAVAMGTGIRQGEQWCLHLADVHVDGATPHVKIQYGSWDPKKKRYLSPKGRKGAKKTRIVPLFGRALEAMKRWLAVLPIYCPKNPLGLAFPTQRGARRGSSKVPRTWARAVEKFGVVSRIGRGPWWHLLRHTCASSMTAGWWGKRWRLEDVRAIMGHSSVKVTERYAHLAESVVHQLATEAQAAWTVRGRVAATPPGSPNDLPDSAGLRSRMSQVRILPSVPPFESPAWQSVATAPELVRGAVRVLERVGSGEPVDLRELVDVVCDLLEEVLAGRRLGKGVVGRARKAGGR